jgi:hypothetical protein
MMNISYPEQNLCLAKAQPAIKSPHTPNHQYPSLPQRTHTCLPPQHGLASETKEYTDTNSVKEATWKDTTQHLHENTVYILTNVLTRCDSDTQQRPQSDSIRDYTIYLNSFYSRLGTLNTISGSGPTNTVQYDSKIL